MRRTLLFLVLILSTSAAALAEDHDVCLERDGERSIEACTHVIETGALTGKDLATVRVVRATLYREMGNYNLAIQDLTRAIEIFKSFAAAEILAAALVTRGSVYALNGENSDARIDYRQALALDPTNTQAAEGLKNEERALASTGGQTTADYPTPNELLPDDIPVDPTIVQLTETNPLFATPPAVRIGSYGVTASLHMITTGGGGTSSDVNSTEAFVSWLRQGLVREDLTTQTAFENAVGAMESTTRTATVSVADGLFSLGSKAVTRNRFGTTTTISKVSRIDNTSGQIFSMQQGSRFGIDVITQINSKSPGFTYIDETTMRYSCEYMRTYDAERFYPGLVGLAHLLNCSYTTTYKKNRAGNSKSEFKSLFFDRLGYWLAVDPISPQEQLIANGTRSTAGKYISTMTGNYQLRSLATAR